MVEPTILRVKGMLEASLGRLMVKTNSMSRPFPYGLRSKRPKRPRGVPGQGLDEHLLKSRYGGFDLIRGHVPVSDQPHDGTLRAERKNPLAPKSGAHLSTGRSEDTDVDVDHVRVDGPQIDRTRIHGRQRFGEPPRV